MKVTPSLLLAAATSLVVAGLVAVAPAPASAASLTEVTNFGTNPGGMRMHVYVPDTRPATGATPPPGAATGSKQTRPPAT